MSGSDRLVKVIADKISPSCNGAADVFWGRFCFIQPRGGATMVLYRGVSCMSSHHTGLSHAATSSFCLQRHDDDSELKPSEPFETWTGQTGTEQVNGLVILGQTIPLP